MNALPLGTRIEFFAPEQVFCHACPGTPQTLRHFVFSCTLAQQVWQDFERIFELSSSVTLNQALFSWPSGGSRFLGRENGFRLQAGHAVAIHTLWCAHTQAVYDDVSTSRPAISNRFRFLLRRHFQTLLSSSKYASRVGSLPFLLR